MSLALAAAVALSVPVRASGLVGIYAIVEKVVFEPNEQRPDRVQIWGSFVFADSVDKTGATASPAKRGYMYFTVPAASGPAELARREWLDLKAVAGTGQAVGFGQWFYIGTFASLRVDGTNSIYGSTGGAAIPLTVRPASEAPRSPAPYETNAGIVRLGAGGTRAAVFKVLQDALKP